MRKLMSLATHYKRWALTFRFNNWKLQKIITLQQRKKKMYEGVAELKLKVQHYQAQHKSLLKGDFLKQSNLRKALLELEKPEEKKEDTPVVVKEEGEENEQIDTTAGQEPQKKASFKQQQTNRLMDKIVERVQGIKEFSEVKAKASKALESQFKMSLL